MRVEICLLVFLQILVLASLVFAQSGFEGELNSFVGANRECSKYPENTMLDININEKVDISKFIEESCPNGIGLVDTYDSEWNPLIEFKDDVFVCNLEEGCIAEVYCCPYDECVNNEDCRNAVGVLSRCTVASCDEWGEGYRCDINRLTEKNISYQYNRFNYCTGVNSSNYNYKLGFVMIVIILVIIYFNRSRLVGKR
ncbi:hypothetical protein CMI38_03405 [Candidatus Pacearchaeota archaeon]|nr:hypothetical protein [Candidatus Pacearchaeota archaeon]|tara:strand:- start:107 stop:700 length:594 start_codon:yes stop_codon:yes gene_type:complete